MRQLTTILFGLILAAGLDRARAQVQGAIQQVDSVQQRRQIAESLRSYETGDSAPELYPGESGDVGPQSVLKVHPRKTHFEVMADAQYFHTDNLFLNQHNKTETDVLVSTAMFALAPTPYDLGRGKFTPRIGYQHDWFDFGLASGRQVLAYDFETQKLAQTHVNRFDFNAQTVFVDGRWRYEDWVVGAGFDFQRLMDTSSYDQFYRESVPRWGLQRLLPLDDTKAFSIGYEGDYRFSDTDHPPLTLGRDFNNRTDHNLLVAYSQNLCRPVVVQPYYRFQYTRFTSGESRHDYLHSFGVGLYWSITRQIALRGFVTYDIMDTNSQLAQDYKKLDAGGGLNLTIRF